MKDVTQVQYEVLNQLKISIAREAGEIMFLAQQTAQKAEATCETWTGEGADSFSQEMTEALIPALTRTALAWEAMGQALSDITNLFSEAEKNAADNFQAAGGQAALASGDAFDESGFPLHGSLPQAQASTALSAEDKSWIDQVLEWLDLPWYVDLPLSVLAVGDVLDLVREQILKRFAGKEPDMLITVLAGFGLVAELGWLNPVPSGEDIPNAALAVLKRVAKAMPAGAERNALAELAEKALKHPDDMKKLGELSLNLLKHEDILEAAIKEPRIMAALVEGGPQMVEIFAKHGDDALDAARLLGGDAEDALKWYNEIANIKGASNVLQDLGNGVHTFGAYGELYYARNFKDDILEMGVKINGRKSADFILKDHTLIDVKNFDFSNSYYANPNNLKQVIRKIEAQVGVYRRDYGAGQKIQYVFVGHTIDEIPPALMKGLQEIGVDVRALPPGL
jgi:uncharacterized protein YukE